MVVHFATCFAPLCTSPYTVFGNAMRQTSGFYREVKLLDRTKETSAAKATFIPDPAMQRNAS